MPEKSTVLIGILLMALLAVAVLVGCSPAGDRPTLLYFRASNCPYCRQMTPIVDEIRDRYGRQLTVEYATVDEPEGKLLGRQHGIIGYPTMLLLNSQGEQVGILRGVVPKTTLEKMVDEILPDEK